MEIVGFLNVQYAVKDEVVYVLEANPRSTRTIPFLAKATQRPEAKIGVKVMLGAKLKDFDLESKLTNWAIKEPVFPFDKFTEGKEELVPEMNSTGETLSFRDDLNEGRFRKAYAFRNPYPDHYTKECATAWNRGPPNLQASAALTPSTTHRPQRSDICTAEP